MKSKMFPILSSPAKIGNVTLKNRILKAPQSSGMNNKDGTVSERAIRYYSDQAKGGAGAIIVEYAYVDEIGSKSAHCHLGISSDEHIPGLSWLAECIRDALAQAVEPVRRAVRAACADHRGNPGYRARLWRRRPPRQDRRL